MPSKSKLARNQLKSDLTASHCCAPYGLVDPQSKRARGCRKKLSDKITFVVFSAFAEALKKDKAKENQAGDNKAANLPTWSTCDSVM